MKFAVGVGTLSDTEPFLRPGVEELDTEMGAAGFLPELMSREDRAKKWLGELL